MKTYVISDQSITCLKCGMTSYNPFDIQARYCGECHEFHAMSRCDFCMISDVNLPGEYRSTLDLLIVEANYPRKMQMVDDGIWMACAVCKALIDEELWEKVVERAVTGMMTMQLGLGLRLNDKTTEAEFKQSARLLLGTVFGKRI